MEADGIGQPSLGHPNPTMPSIDHRLIDQIINRTHATPNPPSKKNKNENKTTGGAGVLVAARAPPPALPRAGPGASVVSLLLI